MISKSDLSIRINFSEIDFPETIHGEKKENKIIEGAEF